MAALVILASAWASWYVRRHLQRVAVVGPSMEPTLRPGDRLVIWRTVNLQPGDIVAVADPREPGRTVLKRVASRQAGEVYVLGDNPERSTDSRHFGPVPVGTVTGKAVYRYAPPTRAGKLPTSRLGTPGLL